MGTRKRITKKELKHDALLEGASKTTRFVEQHMNKTLFVLAALVIVIVVWNFASRSRKATELEAGAALTTATQVMSAGLISQAADQLQVVIDEYPGTRSAGSAMCHLGAIRFQEGRYDDALTSFEAYLDRYGTDGILGTAALEGRAAVLEQQREFIPAGEVYVELAHQAEDNPAAYSRYMMSAARVYKAQPDWERAADAAQQVIDKAPDTYLAGAARMALAEAQARIGA